MSDDDGPKTLPAEQSQTTERKGFLGVIHDRIKIIGGILAGVAAIITAVFGLMELGNDDTPTVGIGIGTDTDTDTFCETWRSNTSHNAVMAGFTKLAASGGDGPSAEQVAQVTNELVKASDRAAAQAPADIHGETREYARLQDLIAREVALNDYRLYSETQEEAAEIGRLFNEMHRNMFTIELWSRDNC